MIEYIKLYQDGFKFFYKYYNGCRQSRKGTNQDELIGELMIDSRTNKITITKHPKIEILADETVIVHAFVLIKTKFPQRNFQAFY